MNCFDFNQYDDRNLIEATKSAAAVSSASFNSYVSEPCRRPSIISVFLECIEHRFLDYGN